jgi:hypothetical protein
LSTAMFTASAVSLCAATVAALTLIELVMSMTGVSAWLWGS